MGNNGIEVVAAPPPLTIAPPVQVLKLDLGAGENCREGFESVDLFAPNAKHKVNLLEFPWPWADSSVDELHSSHFIEHIPMVYVTGAGFLTPIPTDENSRDLLCRFIDEAYRVLVPGGKFMIVVPSGRSNRGFQDPTHRRFFVAESFLYFNKGFREANKIGHYLCSCDFDVTSNPIVPVELTLLHPEAQARRFNEGWNTTVDFHAFLTSRKPK